MAEVLYTPEENPLPVSGGSNVDPDNFYTKEDADSRFQAKGDYATSSDLKAKADQSELDDLKARVKELEGSSGGGE